MSEAQSTSQSGPAPAPKPHPTASTAGGSRRVFHEDVVRARSTEGHPDRAGAGVVLRCWQREDGEPHDPPRDRTGKNRPLNQGEIGVFWSPSDVREIINEDEVEVVDRALHVGDVCKRSHKDKASCVIVEIKRKLTLEHVISRKKIDHEVPAADLQNAVRITRGDYVVANDWVGVVEEVFEEALVESSDSTELTRIFDVGSSLPVGHVRPETYQEGYFVWESQFRSGRLPSKMTILDVRQTVLYINWLAMNQTLPWQEQEKRPRPKRYWSDDIDKLTLVRSFSDYCQAVGDRVVFRSKALAKQHGVEPTFHGPERLPVNVLHVTNTTTKAQVIWQDGTQTEEDASTLLPYINVDEYEAWPGDWVWWQGEGESPKAAIVQTMDPEERTAEIRLYGTDTIETVPVLELNVHGIDPDTFGIHRGDVVMIDKHDHSMPLPALPRVGQGEEVPPTGKLHQALGKRGVELSAKHMQHTPLSAPKDPKRDAVDIDWYGTVTELHLDGSIVISLPGGGRVSTQLKKLSLLGDTFEDDYMDENEMDNMAYDEFGSEYEDEAAMWLDEEGYEVTERDDWEDVDVEDDGAAAPVDLGETTPGTPPDPEVAEIVVDVTEEGREPKQQHARPMDESTPAATAAAAEVEMPPAAVETAGTRSESLTQPQSQLLSAGLPTDDPRWSRFEILEAAPSDHAFLKEPAGSTSSAAYFKRIQREFKVLQTSLPDSILVRSYEDRSDLLRVLIIGSEGTPYEDAPFVIDFHLKPSYPQEPPVAHFHSWTSGSGRVSPNLYEEGKVCLSILGTWSGQESESWSATKSSLLQVLVSIQGLVLVREPWFTEPAYEKLKGTEEGEVNSAHYSEKAFVLARGFVRRALEQPPTGLEDELAYLYYGDGGEKGKGRLQKVMKRCRDLIAETEEAKRRKALQAQTGATVATSKANGDAKAAAATVNGTKERGQDDSILHISMGSCIVLRRHLTVLERLWNEKSSSSSSSSSDGGERKTEGETGTAAA